jgi:hypothetical protein
MIPMTLSSGPTCAILKVGVIFEAAVFVFPAAVATAGLFVTAAAVFIFSVRVAPVVLGIYLVFLCLDFGMKYFPLVNYFALGCDFS